MSALIPTHELSAAEFFRRDCQPVPKLVHMILLFALKDRATDVTFEPQQDEYRLSYRVDGKLYDLISPPLHLASAISQVFKILAELDVCIQRTVQVGRLRLLIDDGTADVMVSVWPTRHGDAIRVEIEQNSTSVEQIQRQLMEYKQGRPKDAEPTSWLERLWRLIMNLGRTARD